MKVIECNNCGELFETDKKSASYCSSSCKQNAYRNRKKKSNNKSEELEMNYPVLFSTDSDDVQEAEIIEEYEKEAEPTQPSISNGRLSDEQLGRQIRANRVFISHLSGLERFFSIEIKKSLFFQLIDQFENLRDRYMELDLTGYTYYPFADTLEIVIEKVRNYYVESLRVHKHENYYRKKKKVKKLKFHIDPFEVDWLSDLKFRLLAANRNLMSS